MSNEQLSYSPCYVKAWSLLAIVVALCLLAGFIFCNHLLHYGHDVWNVIRWIFGPEALNWI